MLRKPFIRMVVLSCIAFSVGCGDSEPNGAPNGTTEVDLLISDPETGVDELALLVDFVSYRITCLNNTDLTPYDDSVDIAGNFEIDPSADPPIWQMATSLPLSTCTITLWVFYEGQVVCSGSEGLEIIEDSDPSTTNKADIVLECSLSVSGPSADVDVDGSFEFIHGNYCPKLLWLGAVSSTADPAVMNVEASFFDPDDTCGQNCDPQTCDFTTNPPVCTSAQAPPLTSTLSAPSGYGTFDNVNASNTTYNCDPLFPGPTDLCVVVSDGDLECDQTRCRTMECP